MIVSKPSRPCSRGKPEIFARRHKAIRNRMRPPSKQCRGKWSEEGDNGFHASPFALRRASRALRIAVCQSVSSHSVPFCIGKRSPIARIIISRHESTAESKSGAAEMRRALACISSMAQGQFGMSQTRTTSEIPSPASMLAYSCGPSKVAIFQGAGVWSVLFIVLCCVVVCCVVEGKSCGGIIGNDHAS